MHGSAIAYGGGGLGGEVARTFAREGARVFPAGRTRETRDAEASDIRSGDLLRAVVNGLRSSA